MKSKALTLIYVLFFLSFHQYIFAQQKGIDDLVEQYKSLLHPASAQAKNSLSYTQHYLDLKKKVAALGGESKTAFENGIAKFSSDTGYAALHAMLFAEAASQTTMDSVQNKNASNGMNVNAGAPNSGVVDSTVQMQVFDKKRKLLGTTAVKPADLENKMKKDGYQISAANYDFTTHSVVLTLTRNDGSGTTARVTLPSTGDMDAKYKLPDGRSLTVHGAPDGTSTMKVGVAAKTSKQGSSKKN